MAEEVVIPPANAGTTGFVYTKGSGSHQHGVSTADFYESQAETVEAIAATNVAVEKTGAANQLTTNVALQNLANLVLGQTNGLSVQAQTFQASTNLAIVTTSAAAALTAATNTAAIQAALAECCCEIKERVREDGEKTRDLISSLDAQNKAIQLVDAKNEITLLKLGAGIKS